MATVAASAASPPSGGLIDPTKQAEYPILLGDKLAGKGQKNNSNGFIGITYNHKSKSASRQQRATITAADSSQHFYKLTLQDKAPNADQTNLVHTYHGSVDPTSLISESETSNLVLVFDPKRKAFLLEPVTARLNFNLRSAPGKTTRRVTEQYPQLNVLSAEDHVSGDDQLQEGAPGEDEGEADDSNPYDFRHFLPKPKVGGETAEIATTPDAQQAATASANSRLAPPPPATGKPKSKPAARAKPQTNPLRQQKWQPKATAADKGSAKPKPKSAPRVDEADLAIESSFSDRENTEQKADDNRTAQADPSPGANIIVDGNLIIDMGSPPPARPPVKLNPRHFSSNNTSANEADYDSDDEGEIEDLRLPSPASANNLAQEDEEEEDEDEEEEERGEVANHDEVIDDDDDLAAEMEAAFEESAREEEKERAQRLLEQQQQMQQHVVSDDESEVSEEE
ncbi:hypothetical protein AJ79_07972 [Helicocarpus griseus UAMH5409]|uniref:Transcription elongation factor Eaf N-terminal domain-containing protein n=1 Tax=Helicocarpus griseus UAMH5409 TaxID=1447875 RepID=A0A2B7WXE0_9EURO|nr:hypothetical protein AJ79_07972 [Helicocarpus griseus UAMH5409]